MPRAIVASLLSRRAPAQSVVVRRDTPFGQLMGEHLLALRRHGAQLTRAEGEAAVRATAHLIAGALGGAPSSAEPVAAISAISGKRALLTQMRSHIEQNLTESALDAKGLCDRFGMSRATLYRLFEPEGGLGRYIQQRRLCRAFTQLTSPRYRHWRIIDIALDSQFGSDATFIRAFRRQFAITPGELRARAELAWAGVRPPLESPETWLERIKKRATGA
jgi:AraC-like DNA-binding protein